MDIKFARVTTNFSVLQVCLSLFFLVIRITPKFLFPYSKEDIEQMGKWAQGKQQIEQ